MLQMGMYQRTFLQTYIAHLSLFRARVNGAASRTLRIGCDQQTLNRA
jgi:hypothetical protein